MRSVQGSKPLPICDVVGAQTVSSSKTRQDRPRCSRLDQRADLRADLQRTAARRRSAPVWLASAGVPRAPHAIALLSLDIQSPLSVSLHSAEVPEKRSRRIVQSSLQSHRHRSPALYIRLSPRARQNINTGRKAAEMNLQTWMVACLRPLETNDCQLGQTRQLARQLLRWKHLA